MSMEKLGVTPFVDRALTYTPEFDPDQMKKVIPYGITYLDKMLLGISPDDLVLLGAPSGCGKSELANQIATNAAYNGYRVVPFALEATPGEWELRSKFRLYAASLIKHIGPDAMEKWTYLDFKMGRMAKVIEPYRKPVEEILSNMKTMSVFYRGREFGIDQFRRVFNALNDKADLVIIDHLHYFDTQDENENREFGEIVKAIRDLNQLTNIPVILVGHLRKKDKFSTELASDLDEFHGTSTVAKVSTTVITLGPGGPVKDSDHRFATYFRIAKCRGDGRVKNFIGAGVFNSQMNHYEDKFSLGTQQRNQQGKVFFAEIPKEKEPLWYRSRGER